MVDVLVVVVVVLTNCFLSADDTEAEADCWTEDDENEAETDELLDMVLSAGSDDAKPASKQTATAARHNRLLLNSIMMIFFFSWNQIWKFKIIKKNKKRKYK